MMCIAYAITIYIVNNELKFATKFLEDVFEVQAQK